MISKRSIVFISITVIIDLVTLGLSIYKIYSVPQLIWQMYTVLDIFLHVYIIIGALLFFIFRQSIKNIWKMEYVLRLELNFVQIGGVMKNKKYASRLIERSEE